MVWGSGLFYWEPLYWRGSQHWAASPGQLRSSTLAPELVTCSVKLWAHQAVTHGRAQAAGTGWAREWRSKAEKLFAVHWVANEQSVLTLKFRDGYKCRNDGEETGETSLLTVFWEFGKILVLGDQSFSKDFQKQQAQWCCGLMNLSILAKRFYKCSFLSCRRRILSSSWRWLCLLPCSSFHWFSGTLFSSDCAEHSGCFETAANQITWCLA